MENKKIKFSVNTVQEMQELGLAVGRLTKVWAEANNYQNAPSIGLKGQVGSGKSTLASSVVDALTDLDDDQKDDPLAEYDLDNEHIDDDGFDIDAWKIAVNANNMMHRVYDMSVFNGEDMEADPRFDCRPLPERDVYKGIDIIEHYQFASQQNMLLSMCINDNKVLGDVRWPREVVLEFSETVENMPDIQQFLSSLEHLRVKEQPQAPLELACA